MTEIRLSVNGMEREWRGAPETSLLAVLRNEFRLTSVKDGCSGEGVCGACLVELNGRPTLSCRTRMRDAAGGAVTTVDGLPEPMRAALARALVAEGAVQCGFCTPGILTRAALLLRDEPAPTRRRVVRALRPHLCRCTGYVKIVDGILRAAAILRGERQDDPPEPAAVGRRYPKVGAVGRALGQEPFVADLHADGLLHGALRLSDHPRARVLNIDTTAARGLPGVVRVITADDVPGSRFHGLIVPDWPLLVATGELTRYVGDVLAVAVAEREEQAAAAAAAVRVEYEVLEPVVDPQRALEPSAPAVHEGGNLLESSVIRRGEPIDRVLAAAAHTFSGTFRTQRVEHAFLETEAALAVPEGDGLRVYSQGQGVYDDRRQIGAILGLPEPAVRVTLVPTGGAFGGKEDLGVQGHAALACHLTGRSVRVRLSRPESIRVHPKRHPMVMEMTVGCDAGGRLTGLRARILGDTGAYASVGGKVLERAAGHATGAYEIPNVRIEARAVYTNNLPCGAMRGFGVCQITFALESCLDELCAAGGFDRWQLRYDNALTEGRMTATGQVLTGGVGVRETLLAVKDEFMAARHAGLACALKNTGIGNGVADLAEAAIEIAASDRVVIHHGWTEMGQGVDTVAVQVLCQETGLDPQVVRVTVSTEHEARGGMTTASRGSVLLGNAIIDAARDLRRDLGTRSLADLVGRTYRGRWVCDWTTSPGAAGEARTHFAYGYATQVVILDDLGRVVRVVAAHDAGKVLNPALFEGQVEGAVAMGLGYALSESLPMEGGRLVSERLADCGLLRADRMPEILVIPVEVGDPVGPYGAKGVGEIGLVATAAAVGNALAALDGRRRYDLPMRPGS